jgi:hypothetical protein
MTPEHREPTKWLFTNALMRQALEAVGEVMGERGLRIVLLQAGLERYADELPPDNVELGVKAGEGCWSGSAASPSATAWKSRPR